MPLTCNLTIQLGLHGFLTAFHIFTRDISCCSSFHTVTLCINGVLDLLCCDMGYGLSTFNKVLFDLILV